MASSQALRTLRLMESWVGRTTLWVPTARNVQSAFQQWASGAGGAVPAFGAPTTVSCFEIVMLAAALSGAKPHAWFQQRYTNVNATPNPIAWLKGWYRALSGGVGNIQPYSANNHPAPGDIVFFNQGVANNMFHHVALATGMSYNGAVVLSFYGNASNAPTNVIRTTIETMVSPGGQCYQMGGNTRVFFSKPRW
jgi:hypothetical protein